jgi:hypothetical protein
MSLGLGGGSSSSKSTSTTPWTGLLPTLAPTLVSGLQSVASGSSIGQGMQAITNNVNQITQTGIQGLKQAFAGSGMGKSTSMLQGISQFVQQQSTGLASQLAQYQQTGVGQQLSALAEIISMASGSGTNLGSQSSMGWNMAIPLLG